MAKLNGIITVIMAIIMVTQGTERRTLHYPKQQNHASVQSAHLYAYIFFFHCSTAPVGKGLLIVEISRSTLRLTTLGSIPLEE